jgi:uncharacterized protein
MAIPEKIIDFHVHLFPDKMFDAVWKAFISNYRWDVLYRMYHARCIEYLHEKGVGKIVYSNYAHKEGIAQGLNEWNLNILEKYDGLYCFAAYHPADKNALEIAETALSHPRVLGIKLQLLVQRFYPHDERLFPMYEMVMDKGKYLLLHAGTGPVGNEYVGLLHFRKLLKRYPGLPAIVAHMGAYEYKGFMDMLDENPNMYLDTAFAFFSEFDGKGSYDLGRQALEHYRKRILYGSDFPNLILPRESEIEALLRYELSDEFYKRVFYENGKELIERTVSGL